jgi:hypothetical protein
LGDQGVKQDGLATPGNSTDQYVLDLVDRYDDIANLRKQAPEVDPFQPGIDFKLDGTLAFLGVGRWRGSAPSPSLRPRSLLLASLQRT